MEGRIEDIEYLEGRSRSSLKAAKLLLKKGFYNETITLSYYATIYALRALFTRDGINAYKPKTMVANFGKKYVITGQIGASFHRNIMLIFDKRYNIDFEPFYDADYDTALEILKLSEDLQREISSLLKSKKIS